MHCPDCQTEVRDGADFCEACGTPLRQPAETLPAAPLEAAPAAPEATAPVGATQYPVNKRKTGLIVAIVMIAVLLLVGCGVGCVLAFLAVNSSDAEMSPPPDVGIVEPEPSITSAGYATAEEAVLAQMAEEGIADWVHQPYDESGGYATYWVGPPSSEWVYEIVVEQNTDGSWSVVEVDNLDFGGGVSDMGPAAEAEFVVIDHLSAVMADRGIDAQALTVEPFRSDAASARVSAGGFDSFDMSGVTELPDGSYWVATTQVWRGSAEKWEYRVVPTDLGFRIADVRAW